MLFAQPARISDFEVAKGEVVHPACRHKERIRDKPA